ncbi:MAG: cobalamin biosynthesis protein CbiX [Verrucomicrobiae bacterium]|nr:cobalamin biosynthesis protein CbiX [Verrucomicrobiae bacterium]
MEDTTFQDAALILVAHGSTKDGDSCGPAYLQGETLRRRGVFAEVIEAFVQQEPSVTGALRRVFSPRVFVVPLFVADGWFTEVVVPVEMGLRAPEAQTWERVVGMGGRRVHYARAVGSHPAMTEVLRARAREVVARHPMPRAPEPSATALVVAGHGTSYSPASREAIEQQVTLLRRAGEYAEVHAVFIEEAPLVGEVWDVVQTKDIVLVPFFISDGLHVAEDIPVMLGESAERVSERREAGVSGWRNPTERSGKRLWLARALGTEPLLAEVILERAREVAAAGGV